MIEVTKFRLVDGVSTEDFLEKNAEFQQRFIYQQDGLLRRTVASGLEGEWVSITSWRSMKDARRSQSELQATPVAAEFSALLEPTSVSVEYFKELPG
jgi:hypothetical protein